MWRIRSADNGNIIFIDVYDGTCQGSLNFIFENAYYSLEKESLRFEDLSNTKILSIGCSVEIFGVIVKSPKSVKQEFEIHGFYLKLIGGVENAETYPIQKSTEKNMVTLRNMPFMRMRAPITQTLFRMR